MKRGEPASIGDILKKLFKTSELGRKLEQSRIYEAWPQLAGPSLAEHGRPFGIKDQTLVIEVDSTVWMNRYAYNKWHILKRVNRLFNKEVISDIYVILTPDNDLMPPQ